MENGKNKLERECVSKDVITSISCEGDVKERYDNNLSCGVHCDAHYSEMVENCRKRSW